MSDQDEFDRDYITSTEVCSHMGVTRSTVMRARERGDLPDPIIINGDQLTIWKREKLLPHLENWKATLRGRLRGSAA